MLTNIKKRSLWIVVLIFSLLLPAAKGYAETSVVKELERTFIQVAEEVQPSVVNISTVQKITTSRKGLPERPFHGPFEDFFGEDFFERFFPHIPDREFELKSLGSGLIVDEQGYILTNNHVIEKADEITIRLSDKTKFTGEVLGKDPKTDLAVIKIDPAEHRLKAAKLGDSDKIKIGQWAIAIGNPFGLDRTVTVGVISATGRSDIGIATYENYLQTDASINPGNSGGPLINLEGEVVGINTAIVASGQGIGFAVPINMAKLIMQQLIEHGRVVRGWMGIAIQPITEELGKQFGVKEGEGVLVGQVFKGDPADRAGIKVGDVIVEFDRTPINSPGQLSRLAATTPPDKTVELHIIRDGKHRTVEITLGELKEDKVVVKAKEGDELYGMQVDNITPQLAEKYNLSQKEGIVVTQIHPGGAAYEAGLREGDAIVEVNRQKITNLQDYKKLLKEIKEGENLIVLRIRNQNSLYVVVEPK